MTRIRFLALITIFVLLLSACAPAQVDTPPVDEAPADIAEPVEGAPLAEEQPAEEDEPAESDSSFPVTIADGLGNEVTVESAPQRIISLTLGTDEILLDLVGPDRLLGVTYLASDETTSNIAADPALAEVENVVEANPEQIIALEPDLVFVGSFTDAAVIEQLQNAGLTVFAVGFFTSIDAMQQNILDIGALVGESDGAQALVDDMNATLESVAAQVEAVDESPTVLFYASDGWVAGSATTTDDIIASAGGVNVAADLIDWNQISAEAIIEYDPDVVILSPYVTDDEFLNNPAFASLSAIQNNRVYTISDATMSATSQYIVQGVVDVATVLYPDLDIQ